ncbi:MAG: hypothetical protein IPH77_20845 [Ignavibacteria bacterium]|nr:hypothetical protein [Ignavibacteria bacterium]
MNHYTFSNNAWCVASSGSVVHVVWYITMEPGDILQRSIDGARKPERGYAADELSASSWNPSVTVSGLVVHVVWQDDRNGNTEIYYKRFDRWWVGVDTRLTNNASSSVSVCHSISVRLCMSGSTIVTGMKRYTTNAH